MRLGPPILVSAPHPRSLHACDGGLAHLVFTHLLQDLHADGTLGNIPDDAGLAVVPLVGHALRRAPRSDGAE
eukprot:366020-Chlamydomonas_euryale.AAC.9